jgi:Protein of unknown function (DUF2786)
MSENDRSKVMDKIRKLLLKAADNRTPVNERSTARAIADKMMARYKISEMEVLASTTVDDIPEDMQDAFINDVMKHADQIINALENKKDEVILKMVNDAQGYLKSSKETLKKTVTGWIDGLFK